MLHINTLTGPVDSVIVMTLKLSFLQSWWIWAVDENGKFSLLTVVFSAFLTLNVKVLLVSHSLTFTL